jgi:hypothetical protein
MNSHGNVWIRARKTALNVLPNRLPATIAPVRLPVAELALVRQDPPERVRGDTGLESGELGELLFALVLGQLVEQRQVELEWHRRVKAAAAGELVRFFAVVEHAAERAVLQRQGHAVSVSVAAANLTQAQTVPCPPPILPWPVLTSDALHEPSP